MKNVFVAVLLVLALAAFATAQIQRQHLTYWAPTSTTAVVRRLSAPHNGAAGDGADSAAI